MTISRLKGVKRALKYYIFNHPDKFLVNISGLLHVGANSGQERFVYNELGLKVIWIEPIPSVFKKLEQNLVNFKDQNSYKELITNVDKKEYKLNIANNNGASSSILEFKHHSDIKKWSGVKYSESIQLSSLTLPTFIKNKNIDLKKYQALVLDTQGSELLILQGCVPILENFKYIKLEVPDFESYKGCCQVKDIEAFMEYYGFEEYSKHRFISDPNIGSYFDIVYKRFRI